MKRRVAEQTVLFISVLKWVTLATIVGAIVGTSTAIFLQKKTKKQTSCR